MLLGCDSHLLETRYQELVTRGDKGDLNRWIVRVRGEMYEANLQDKTCDAIFWKGQLKLCKYCVVVKNRKLAKN